MMGVCENHKYPKSGDYFYEREKQSANYYRVCSKPIMDALEIYKALGYKAMPFYRLKFVYRKSEIQNVILLIISILCPDTAQLGLKK
ncbi:MAG TPA: hypothetical protein ENN84_10710 [Candidatus Marinimicrobia bacterium]|nr:hypothetical protein [Candidatus Neomarinimicrobiota bacterium]